MALKNNGNRSSSSNSNRLHRSTTANDTRGLQALGNLARINPESRGSALPLSTSYLQYPMSAPGTVQMGPPPLPPRRSPYMSSYNRYPGMSSYYSPYSRYSSGYGGYSGYRMPHYGPYGASNEGYNSFVQMAEESTRPAFESIESVVEVVSSISMMLESTYHAVHSSYSAILGVVDQFSRLKDHLAQMLSVLALLRGLRWLCLKVLYLLKLRKENPTIDAAWNSAEQVTGSSLPAIPGEAQGSAWPFLMFLGLVIGAPWLMFKLLSKNIAKKSFDPRLFVDDNGKRYVATAAYDFAATQPSELSFRAGERLSISPKSLQNSQKGWVLACNSKQETGMIPSNYLKVQSRAVARNTPLLDRRAAPEENILPNQVAEAFDDFDDSVKPPETPDGVSVEKSAEQLEGVLVEKSPISNDETNTKSIEDADIN